MTRKILPTLFLGLPLFALAGQPLNVPDPDTLSGDKADACSVILCLSSSAGSGLSECQGPLSHYYSISAQHWSNTVHKRKDFLSLCPTGDFDNKNVYFNDLANGAGRCNAAQLNVSLKESRSFQSCHHVHDGETCDPITKWRISNQLPDYCQALFNNGYTEFWTLSYQGTPTWQTINDFNANQAGKWVDD